MAAQRTKNPMPTLNWKETDITQDICLPVNWDALEEYALRLRRSVWQGSSAPPFSTCVLLPQYNFGGVHLVRLVEFDDGERWAARVQRHSPTPRSSQRLVHQVHTVSYIHEQARIPVPRVFGFESTDANPVGVPFSLMEFIPGDTAMDAFGGYDVHRGEIPELRKWAFMQQVARIQVEISSLRFSKIGRLIRLHDGSYTIGPFADLGGPFSTAAEYLKAWAHHAKFPQSEAEVVRLVPKGLEEISSSIRDFPSRLAAIADQLPLNTGPFPLYHTDFRHSNIIIDRECDILSVIDWDDASTVPWEVVEFPLFLGTTPPPMDVPWNYDDQGLPKDYEGKQRWYERSEYLRFVKEAEAERELDQRLSTTLADQTVQNLAGALKLFLDPGKFGFYGRVLDQLSTEANSSNC